MMETKHDGNCKPHQTIVSHIDIVDVIAEKIYQWLSAPDPSTNHNDAQKKKQSATGEWFTQSTEFADWKKQPNSFLWLHGIR